MTTETKLCMICKEEFEKQKELDQHLAQHTKREMILTLRKARMYHN